MKLKSINKLIRKIKYTSSKFVSKDKKKLKKLLHTYYAN